MPDDRMHPAVRQPQLPARRDTAPKELVAVRARADVFRARLDESRERFRLALAQLSERSNDLNPVNRMRAHPWRWVIGGFALGLVFGFVTTRD